MGIDKLWPSHFLLNLMDLQPQRQFKNGSYIIDGLLAIKSDKEQTFMKEASRLNDLAMEKLLGKLHLGLSEKKNGSTLSPNIH